jgi:CO/xanthine dehydrogenase FAD-binding subunit
VSGFAYVRARSVEEAASSLRELGTDAKLLAGGQSLLPLVNLGLARPSALVDIGRAEGLAEIERENGTLRIGALVRHRTLETSALVAGALPMLASAVGHVGSPRVRNRGTLGGSICHADPSAELPLTMSVLGAEYELSDGSAPRSIPASEFPVSFFTTALADGEILTHVRVPVPPAGTGWGFREMTRRAGDFAIVAAAAVASCRGGIVETLRLGLAGVADRPVRCDAFEAAAPGTAVERLGDLEDAVAAAVDAPSDTAASGAYRARLACVLGLRAAADACARAMGETP